LKRQSRLTPVDCNRLSIEQQTLFDQIVVGPRAAAAGERELVDEQGHMGGPFNAWLHVPAIGARWSAIGEVLRFQSSLDRRLFEMVVLVVAAHAQADHEWAAHSELAVKAGLPRTAVEAIGRREMPSFARSDEMAVYILAAALVRDLRVLQPDYDRALALLGQAAVIEIVSVVGYYLALAIALNAFEVEPPPGSKIPWRVGAPKG
jgi:4-carboxymuconolactone decarboxylase